MKLALYLVTIRVTDCQELDATWVDRDRDHTSAGQVADVVISILQPMHCNGQAVIYLTGFHIYIFISCSVFLTFSTTSFTGEAIIGIPTPIKDGSVGKKKRRNMMIVMMMMVIHSFFMTSLIDSATICYLWAPIDGAVSKKLNNDQDVWCILEQKNFILHILGLGLSLVSISNRRNKHSGMWRLNKEKIINCTATEAGILYYFQYVDTNVGWWWENEMPNVLMRLAY